jgi:hypothetical protein
MPQGTHRRNPINSLAMEFQLTLPPNSLPEFRRKLELLRSCLQKVNVYIKTAANTICDW